MAMQMPTLRRILKEEGKRAIWSGVQARVLFHFPASAICWGTYETMKSMLHRTTAAEQQQGLRYGATQP